MGWSQREAREGQATIESGLYRQGVTTVAFAAIAFAAIVGTRSHHQFRILGREFKALFKQLN